MLRTSATTMTPPTRAATMHPKHGRTRPTSRPLRAQPRSEQPPGPAPVCAPLTRNWVADARWYEGRDAQVLQGGVPPFRRERRLAPAPTTLIAKPERGRD